MKLMATIILSAGLITLLCGEYEVDLRNGVFRFSSEEEAVESGITSEFSSTKSFVDFKLDTDPRVETKSGAPVDPMPIRFHSRNRLRNGDLLIVKQKRFGSNLRDGYRYIFYFYGAGDMGSCLEILNGELGLDNKYFVHQFKRNNEYSWVELRSRFILLD